MDEKKNYLVNIESNLQKYADEAVEAKKRVDDLRLAQEVLKVSGKEGTVEWEKTSSALRGAQKEYSGAKKMVDLQTAGNKSETGSRKQLGEILTLQMNALGKLSNAYITDEKGMKRLNPLYVEQRKRIAETKQSILDYDKALNDGRSNVGRYSESLQGATGALTAMPGPLGRAATAVQSLGKQLWLLVANPIGLVIAAIAAAIAAMTSYFRRSEEGQNSFQKVMKVLASILDNILDVVDKVGKAIFDAFTKPKEAIKIIGEFIQSQVTNRIQALKDIASAVGKIFSKEWKQGFKELGESTVQLYTGVDNFIDKVVTKVKAFGEEVRADIKASIKLADELAQIAKDERKYLVENAKLNAESSKLRADAEKLKFLDANQSIELIKKAFDIDEQILEQELNIAKRKAANAKESARLANSTIETLNNVAKFDADVATKQGQFEDKRRERLRTLNKLKKEAFNQEKEQLTAIFEIEKSKTAGVIENNKKIIANDLYTYAERIAASKENIVLQSVILNKQAELDLKEIEKDYELETLSKENADLKKLAVTEKTSSEILKLAATANDEQKKLIDELAEYEYNKQKLKLQILELGITNEFELRRKKLENDHLMEIKNAQRIGSDINLINEKYALLRINLSKIEADEKLKVYADFAGSVAGIFQQHTIMAKVAAIAEATINTWLGATQALKTYPPPLSLIMAGTQVAAGIGAIAKIVAVDTNVKGGGSRPTALTSSPAARNITVNQVQSSILTNPQLSQSQLNALPQNMLSAADIANAMSKMPPQKVSVVDINERMSEVSKIQVRANI